MEWPFGFKPQSSDLQHDSLYRVVGVDYEYTQDGGERTVIDVGVDWRSEMALVHASDPMRTLPAPMVAALPETRVISLTFQHDWLANLVDWTDDAHSFYERSIGTVTNGSGEPDGRPSALRLATNLPTSPPAQVEPGVDRGGWAYLEYGEGGNVIAMTVRAQCTDTVAVCYDPASGSVAERVSSMATSCACSAEQHYQYRWDELNRLTEARRYDRAGSGQ